MEWAEFKRKHRQAHLVVAGEYNPLEAFFRVSHFGIVGRLVVALRPGGERAIEKVRLPRWLAIHVAYERHADALALSSLVGASPGCMPTRRAIAAACTPIGSALRFARRYWRRRRRC